MVGILGYSFTTPFLGNPLEFFEQIYYVDICTLCFYHGVNWIYTFVENTSFNDVKLWYLWFLSMVFQDPINAYFTSYFAISSFFGHYQFYASLLLDLFFFLKSLNLPYMDEWYNAFFMAIDTTSSFYYYPELMFIFNNVILDYILPFSTTLRPVIKQLLNSEVVFSAVMLFPQYITLLVGITLGLMLYFNFYVSSTREENLIDHDFLIANATVDAEEEIGSLDDVLFGFLIFFYIFAWFFYVYFWSLVTFLPELMIVFWLFPFVYVIILIIPSSLLFDFGIYFLGYLRGVGSSPLFLSETLFDYIAIFAFFIRLVVQGVRLLLMFFVYASFHDLILFWSWDVRWFYSHELFWQDLYNLDLTLSSVTYFFFLKLPTHLIYFIYELLHTFFVVTAQFFAFIGMVFWLFFFLYTFFTFEPHEAYLNYKRTLNEIKKFFNEKLRR